MNSTKSITDVYKPVTRPEKVLQFGEGGFLRAFVDWHIDIANEKGGFNGNVVIIQPIARGMADTINAQKGLYTTILRGMQNGKYSEEDRVIKSVSRCINPYSQFNDYFKCAENPDLRFVFSNTTEAGIAWADGEKLEDKPQVSFPGKVTAFLYHRFQCFKGDKAKALVLICCELIDNNADCLREYVYRHAKEWGIDSKAEGGVSFKDWLDACDFCNSLVDRVVNGYPRAEFAKFDEKFGYKDNLLDAAEIFHLWVIESKQDHSRELPFGKAGLDVVWTHPGDAVGYEFYHTRKVRILNGAHTSGVLAGFLYGLDNVEQCVRDPLIGKLFDENIFNEIIPSIVGATGNDDMRNMLKKYANDVLERFHNPIDHRLLSISLNSVSKWKARVLPSVQGYYEKLNKCPAGLALSLAALIAFYNNGGKGPVEGACTGKRKNEDYPIKDDEAVLNSFAELYGSGKDAKAIAHAVLSNKAWWDEDLCKYPGFEAAVAADLEAIQKGGLKALVEKTIG